MRIKQETEKIILIFKEKDTGSDSEITGTHIIDIPINKENSFSSFIILTTLYALTHSYSDTLDEYPYDFEDINEMINIFYKDKDRVLDAFTLKILKDLDKEYTDYLDYLGELGKIKTISLINFVSFINTKTNEGLSHSQIRNKKIKKINKVINNFYDLAEEIKRCTLNRILMSENNPSMWTDKSFSKSYYTELNIMSNSDIKVEL